MRPPQNLELMLFEHDPDRALQALGYGINTFLIDWEFQGKEQRQSDYDTEINPGTAQNLSAIAALPGALAWCRINPWCANSTHEIEAAVAAGAYGLFLPMVRRLDEVAGFISAIDGRCQAAILIETPEAVALAAEIAKLPLDRVYFGLNDFAICRGQSFIFEALQDGSVAKARRRLGTMPFGFGGATAIDLGAPIPCRSLLAEMARLNCQFTFLRRSFKKDITQRPPETVVAGIHERWAQLMTRTPDEVEHDLQQLSELLNPLCSRHP